MHTMEDFNQPSPERNALLERLQESIGDVPPHFWAACQLCDLDALKTMVDCGRKFPGILRGFTLQTSKMAHYWGESPPKTQSQASTPVDTTPHKSTLSNPGSSPMGPPPKRQKVSDSPETKRRSRKARDLAAERDKFSCILTGTSTIQVAHIYPFHSMSHQEADSFGQRHVFWDHLKNFWPEDKIAAWEAELFPAGLCDFGMESAHNLITLSYDAHALWARGAFALRPICESEDKTTLELQFFWQKRQQEDQTAMSLSATPFSTEGLSHNADVFKGIANLFKRPDGAPIRSGDYFTLQTDDPEIKPLPSFKLLELQWFLQRVAGMAGAAEYEWPSLSEAGSDYSDDDIPELQFDGDEDLSFISSQQLSSPAKLVRNDNSALPIPPKHQEAEVDGGRALVP